MHKEFKRWGQNKEALHENSKVTFYKVREVWWCAIGINIGSEQDGTGKNFDRPVLIVKDLNQKIFFGVPLTGHERYGKHYFYIGKTNHLHTSALLSQARVWDSKRLIRKMYVLNKPIFDELKDRLYSVLFI